MASSICCGRVVMIHLRGERELRRERPRRAFPGGKCAMADGEKKSEGLAEDSTRKKRRRGGGGRRAAAPAGLHGPTPAVAFRRESPPSVRADAGAPMLARRPAA